VVFYSVAKSKLALQMLAKGGPYAINSWLETLAGVQSVELPQPMPSADIVIAFDNNQIL